MHIKIHKVRIQFDFGSKNRKLDYLYADEFAEFEKNGTLSSLHLAFSREQKDKIYVQHLLAKNGKETWDLIEAGAYIYICGGTSMGKDVVKELGKIVSTIGNKNEEQYLALLKKEGQKATHFQVLADGKRVTMVPATYITNANYAQAGDAWTPNTFGQRRTSRN